MIAQTTRHIAWVGASFGFEALLYAIQLAPKSTPLENPANQHGQINFKTIAASQPVVAKVLWSVGRVVVGDWVEVCRQDGGWVILGLVVRSNQIQRVASYNQLKTQCANIDQLLMVIAPLPTVGFYSIDALLMTCFKQGIEAILIANKCDLKRFQEWFLEWQSYYQWLLPKWFICSTETGEGIEQLKQRMQHRTSFLVGASGVGKSSLLNAMMATRIASTQPLSRTNQGQHTTSNSQVYFIKQGLVIDSPGIKEFLLSDYTNFATAFADITELAQYCRFRNCRHRGEKGCAVIRAVADQQLAGNRLAGYRFFADRMQQQGCRLT